MPSPRPFLVARPGVDPDQVAQDLVRRGTLTPVVVGLVSVVLAVTGILLSHFDQGVISVVPTAAALALSTGVFVNRRRTRRGAGPKHPTEGEDYITPEMVAPDDAPLLRRLAIALSVTMPQGHDDLIDGTRISVVTRETGWRLAQVIERIGRVEEELSELESQGDHTRALRERARPRLRERRAQVRAGVAEIEALANALVEAREAPRIAHVDRLLDELDIDAARDVQTRESMESLAQVRSAVAAVVERHTQMAKEAKEIV
ncbi:hypothetical protein [Nocardiopsis lucentensis]|uniref:hypothetical protein n=1 Tax=Nocardiopsis lucentensis TaxID=53441 RepID=UPI00034744B0|nr:hypothetical protein [Nocardiopsis lucentensis]